MDRAAQRRRPSQPAPDRAETSSRPRDSSRGPRRRPGGAIVLMLVATTLGCRSPAPPHSLRGPAPSPPAAAQPVPRPEPRAAWTIAVISDVHIALDGSIPTKLHQVVAAVIESRPRLVVVTGDFTDGGPRDPASRVALAPRWWRAARQSLRPLRAAGIPVLPIAGNHDSELPAHRIAYAAAWRDLDRWAAPLEIWGNHQPASRVALDAAPFSYGVDVDGVHLTLTHIVGASLDPAVARWIAGDLAAAGGARLRVVFGHVPMSSIVTEPRRGFVAELGGILATGRADLYVAGHEHLVWDDDVALSGGASLRQLLVGTASAPWQFEPSAAARRRARCVSLESRMRCIMPRGGAAFELCRARGRWLEAERYAFVLITIDGATIHARAIAIDDQGRAVPFGTGPPCSSRPPSSRVRKADEARRRGERRTARRAAECARISGRSPRAAAGGSPSGRRPGRTRRNRRSRCCCRRG